MAKTLYKNIVIKGFQMLEKVEGAQGAQADVSVLASTEGTDRDQEIIKQDGIDLTHFLKNPVILFAHKYSEPPIGKAIRTVVTEAGLQIDIKFASAKANPLAQQIKNLMKEGILNAVSIGFIPKERDENDPKIITKSELLELSVVPVPANPEALALAMGKGYSPELFRELKKKKVEKGGHKPDKPKKPKKDEKTPACRMSGETEAECVARKVPEIIAEGEENQERAVAIAHSLCEVKCEDKGAKFEKIDVEKIISSTSERLAKEPKGEKKPAGGAERSPDVSDVNVELRVEVLNLRKETLKLYRQSELVLILTKSTLHKLYEQENKKGSKGQQN